MAFRGDDGVVAEHLTLRICFTHTKNQRDIPLALAWRGVAHGRMPRDKLQDSHTPQPPFASDPRHASCPMDVRIPTPGYLTTLRSSMSNRRVLSMRPWFWSTKLNERLPANVEGLGPLFFQSLSG